MRPLSARACLMVLACSLFSGQAESELTLIPVSQPWRYNYSGVDLTGQFQAPGYDDSSWAEGQGLLGYDLSRPFPYFDPLRTEFPSGASSRNTIYFRTHFDFPSNTLGVVLRATNYVDDGAVFYLNGREVQRVRLPAGAINYSTRAAISNPEGQGNVVQFATTNLQQGDNVLAVEVHQHDTNDPDVIFGMSLIAFLPEPGPVRVTNQPPSRTIEEGDPTTFVAEVNGTPPYFFQWFKNGARINGATNNTLPLNFVSMADAGNYSFIVSNEFSFAASSNATLTITPSPYLFLGITNTWRYHSAGQPLGLSWRNAAFPDTNWSQGTAVFHNTSDPLPAPKGTQLPLTNGSGQNIMTWYFRTRFTWSGPTAGVPLRARTLIDDGAVFYINGVEAGRFGMPGAPATIGYNTPAAYRVETLTNYTTTALSTSSLVQGENVLAVEVHQSSFEASDMVFGLALGTNFTLSLPDLVFWGPASRYTEAQSFSPDECTLNECAAPSTRRVLRFDTETRNIGQSDLVLGDPAGNPLYVHDPCHGHYHLEHFAEYRLLDTNGVQVATGNKVGFCLLDFYAWDPNAAPGYVYDCDYQGIQRGWADIYMSALPCQWIDITGLPGGTYILELEVDPENLIAEADESNNISRVLVSFGDCVPPPNDDFDAAIVVAEPITSIPFDNTCATREFMEPLHAGQEGNSSIWFRWTAPGGGKLLLSTEGSSFDTMLAVYRGSDVANLTRVASDDDSGWYGTSRLTFNVAPGTLYSIAVDGYGGAASNGVFHLHYKPLIPPTFAMPEYILPQQLRLTLDGGASDAYAIESASTNSIWTEWLRVTNRTGKVQVIDPSATTTRKFYRARLLP